MKYHVIEYVNLSQNTFTSIVHFLIYGRSQIVFTFKTNFSIFNLEKKLLINPEQIILKYIKV